MIRSDVHSHLMSKLISCLPNHVYVLIFNPILEGAEVEGLIGVEKCAGSKIREIL